MTYTYTNEKGPGATNSKALHTEVNNADFRSHGAIQQAHDGEEFFARLKALYSRIKDAVSGFYLDRGVGIEAIATLILVAIFATVRGMQ